MLNFTLRASKKKRQRSNNNTCGQGWERTGVLPGCWCKEDYFVHFGNGQYLAHLAVCTYRMAQHCRSWVYTKRNPDKCIMNTDKRHDVGSIPGLGKSPGVENGDQLQYSCLENSMDRGAWWAPGKTTYYSLPCLYFNSLSHGISSPSISLNSSLFFL